MDADRFDRLTRTLSTPLSRRVTVRGLAAGVPLSLGLALDETTVLAKKNGKGGKGKNKQRKKVTLCHEGQTITVSKAAAKVLRKLGDTPGACPPPAPPPEPVTVTCPGPRDTGISGPRRFAQTFTAPVSGRLTTAQVELSGGSATNDFTVEIRSVDDTGKPTATVLASARIEDVGAASPDQPLPLSATLDPPAAVQAGTLYAVVLTVDDGQTFSVSGRDGNDDCPGQLFVDPSATNDFGLFNSLEMIFSVTIVG